MSVYGQMKRAARLAPVATLLWANGCFATLERNLDYLLAPDALENTLALPFAGFAPLTQFVLRFVV